MLPGAFRLINILSEGLSKGVLCTFGEVLRTLPGYAVHKKLLLFKGMTKTATKTQIHQVSLSIVLNGYYIGIIPETVGLISKYNWYNSKVKY